MALADRQYGVVSRAREDAAMDRHEAAAPDPRRHAAVAKDITGHPGAPKLVEILQRHEPGTTLTRSELEERFLALCRAAGLPAPLCNHTVADGDTVDFVFADQRLLVETDSWRWHRSRKQFETDRRRDAADAAHAAQGWRTRFTHDRITHDPRGSRRPSGPS